MKILKIIHGYPPNYNAGSEVYSQSICNELAKAHDLTVFTREENPYLPDFHLRTQKQHDRLQFVFANMPRSKDGYRHTALDMAFDKLLQETQPDIAHIGHLNHLSTGLIDVLWQRGIPIVFTLHDFWLMCPKGQFLQRNFDGGDCFQRCNGQEDRKCAVNCYAAQFSGRKESKENEVHFWTDWVSNRMEEMRSIIQKTNLFIAPSRYLQQRFINDFQVPAEKTVYLDYGFPLHYLTPSTDNREPSVFTFGYIGTHIPAKGVNLLIEAFQQLQVNTCLKIWGRKDGQNTQALMDMAKAAGSNIEFMGEYINKNLADEVFSQVDCIVVPSIWMENSPLVIHEAQACHVPVITANAGGMAEYVNDRINGLLFEHRNIEHLASAMSWAASHPNEMKRFGKRGYLFDEDGQVPSIESHCQQLVHLYQQITQKNATPTLANHH